MSAAMEVTLKLFRHRLPNRGLIAAIALGVTLLPTLTSGTELQVDEDGTTHMSGYLLPESSLLGADTRAVLKQERTRDREESNSPQRCPPRQGADAAHMPAIRKCEAQAFYESPQYKHLRELYRVSLTPKDIGGVYTEIFMPVEGVAARNTDRVLINVHGGGFLGGARTTSHIESVPIASVGQIKVISVDYRQGPENVFPAASEDVASVYRELLKTYKAHNIGIYGCSAGGLLTAEAIAWFQKEKLPLPGAVGMFCEGADYWMDGDSGYVFGAPIVGSLIETFANNPYFKGAAANDPLALPARSAQVMRGFPPSLVISGTRDFALSSAVHTHSMLIAQGVQAELHVWEGLGHAFFFDPDLPQSREAYKVIADFFDSHLGK